MLRLFKPYEVGLPLKRYGNDWDGGYVIADGLKYDCLLSGGLGGNITFEKELYFEDFENNILTTHLFDYSFYSDADRFEVYFHKKDIGKLNNEIVTNLHEYLSEYKNVFIKLDIEGSEFEWLDVLPLELQKNIKQLVIEFHGSVKAIPYIKQLQQTHTIINIHGNNYGGWCKIDGRDFPDIIEVTFLHNTECKYWNECKPSKLNQPNNPYKQEINLDYL